MVSDFFPGQRKETLPLPPLKKKKVPKKKPVRGKRGRGKITGKKGVSKYLKTVLLNIMMGQGLISILCGL